MIMGQAFIGQTFQIGLADARKTRPALERGEQTGKVDGGVHPAIQGRETSTGVTSTGLMFSMILAPNRKAVT